MVPKRPLAAGAVALFALMVLGAAGYQDAKTDLRRQVDAKLDEADRLTGQDKIPEALAAYLEAAQICGKGLASAGDKSLSQNYHYALGQRGLIQIQKAQRLAGEKSYAEAGRLYQGAEEAYRFALAQAGEDKGFQTNLRYARQHGGEARFLAALERKDPAPTFELEALAGGGKVGLAALRGHVVLIEFTAGWCPTCRDSLPILQELQKRFTDKSVRVVLLAVDRLEGWGKSGSAEKSVALAAGKPFPAAWADEAVYLQYGAFSAVPSVVLIDPQGRLAAQVPSAEQNAEGLARRIEALL